MLLSTPLSGGYEPSTRNYNDTTVLGIIYAEDLLQVIDEQAGETLYERLLPNVTK